MILFVPYIIEADLGDAMAIIVVSKTTKIGSNLAEDVSPINDV